MELSVARSSCRTLRFERSFTEDGAKAFLKVFDDTAGFTKGTESDKKPDQAKQPDGQKLGESGDKLGDKPNAPKADPPSIPSGNRKGGF
jgi:hypothetical protein